MLSWEITKSKKILLKTSLTDVNEANLLRRSLLTCVPAIAVEYVTFDVNDSPRPDEILAHRLGLMPIMYDAGVEAGSKISFSLRGSTDEVGNHRRITCADMEGIPWVHPNSTLTWLREDEILEFSVILGSGNGSIHPKYNSVHSVSMKQTNEGYDFLFGTMETHEPESLIDFAFQEMYTASLYKASSPFFKLRVPDSYSE